MIDLSTTFMGLELKNPLIVGSCGWTGNLDSLKKLEANGAAAVVLKSIFEEQITREIHTMQSRGPSHSEAYDYISTYTKEHSLDRYLDLVADAKKNLDIPVIASINCVSASEWVDFTSTLEDSGADAIELNIFYMPGDIRIGSEKIEALYFDILSKVESQVTLPIALKIAPYFSGLAHMIHSLSVRKVAGMVLFNRFHRPDVNLDKMEISAAPLFSRPEENALPLRWIGMLAEEVECDLAASTGIHDGITALKNLVVGARAVQVASVIYQKGPEQLAAMLDEIRSWMKGRKVASIQEVIGRLSQDQLKDPAIYERVQFMKSISAVE